MKTQQKRKNKKNNKPIRKACLLALGIWSSLVSMSLIAEPSVTQDNPTQNTIVADANSTLIEADAKAWGLSTDDYKHYLWLMQNTPSQHWYKHLDPAEVLALNADKPSGMRQYAEIQARNMHVKVTRELAFNKLYKEAYSELYPNEKPIMSPNSAEQAPSLQSGDRVWLFVGVDTPLGRFAYQHLIKAVQATPGSTLDIYFVDQPSQSAIQAWAESVDVPHDMSQVTLNYGDDRFKSLTKDKATNLPFVGIVHGDHFQPINLSSVL